MTMKKYAFFATAIAISLFAGIGIGLFWGGDPQIESTGAMADAPMHQAGPFRLRVSVDPQAPEIGENRVRIELTDLNGIPVDGAQINVVATMLVMGAMPEMRAPATIDQTGPGSYEGPFTLPMDGSWPLTLEVSKEGIGQATVRFEMATRRSGLQLVSGGQQTLQGEAPDELPIGTITVDARRRNRWC